MLRRGLLSAVLLLMVAGCAVPLSGGGLPTMCGVLTTTAGAGLGGVAGSYLAGNSIENQSHGTSKGGVVKIVVTKKQASDGTRALYTMGGVLAGAAVTGVGAHYLCPAAAPTPPAPAKLTENERLHEHDYALGQ